MINPESIQHDIAAGLDCAHLEVSGDGHHFEAIVVSAAFAGKSRIQQHQLVFATLGDRVCAEIHAHSLKTFTPDTWAAR